MYEDRHSLSLQDKPRSVALVKFGALFLGKGMEERVTLPVQQCKNSNKITPSNMNRLWN